MQKNCIFYKERNFSDYNTQSLSYYVCYKNLMRIYIWESYFSLYYSPSYFYHNNLIIHTQNSMYNDDPHIEGYCLMIRDNHNHDAIQLDSLAEESEYHSYKNEKIQILDTVFNLHFLLEWFYGYYVDSLITLIHSSPCTI